MLKREGGLGDDMIEEQRFRPTANQDAFVHAG
jgi:hypothetical protein